MFEENCSVKSQIQYVNEKLFLSFLIHIFVFETSKLKKKRTRKQRKEAIKKQG